MEDRMQHYDADLDRAREEHERLEGTPLPKQKEDQTIPFPYQAVDQLTNGLGYVDVTAEQLDQQERLRRNFTLLQGITKKTNLRRLQNQLSDWTRYNFPNRETFEPLLGMSEELGEASAAYLDTTDRFGDLIDPEDFEGREDEKRTYGLLIMQALLGKVMHHHLKSLQNIRGTQNEHAIAFDEQLDRMLTIGTHILNDDWYEFALAVQNDIIPESKDTLADGLADLLVYCADFANATGTDLTAELHKTWTGEGLDKPGVRARDWVKHRRDAKVVADIAARAAEKV